MKQGWEIKKLGEVCDILMGQSPSSDTYNDSEGLPFFQGNADFGRIHPTIRVYCNAPIRVADIGDILISVRAPIGAINISNVTCCIGRGLSAIKGGKKVCQQFVYHALIANKEKLISQGTGSTFKSIGKNALNDLIVPIPPLSEQAKIVSELDCLSGIIEKKKQQLKELDALAQSIFYEMFGNPVENERGWEVKKLGEVCIIERGGSPRPISEYLTDGEDGVNWIKIGDAVEGSRFINHTEEKIKPEGVKKSRMVYKGDFILSNSMSFGKPYILGLDGCIHDGWLVIRDSNGLFNKNYLYYYLSSDDLYCEFKRLAVGGVVNNLNSKIVRDVNVSIPPLALQHKFASQIESIDKQKALVKQSIAEVETLFNSRMDFYFN